MSGYVWTCFWASCLLGLLLPVVLADASDEKAQLRACAIRNGRSFPSPSSISIIRDARIQPLRPLLTPLSPGNSHVPSPLPSPSHIKHPTFFSPSSSITPPDVRHTFPRRTLHRLHRHRWRSVFPSSILFLYAPSSRPFRPLFAPLQSLCLQIHDRLAVATS